MATFAAITKDRVLNVILAETKEDAELATGCICVEYTTDNPAGVGWIYDGDTKKFSQPVSEEQIAVK